MLRTFVIWDRVSADNMMSESRSQIVWIRPHEPAISGYDKIKFDLKFALPAAVAITVTS